MSDVSTPNTVVRLNKKATGLVAKGRAWFFADDLHGAKPSSPQLVRAEDQAGRDYGLAFYSPKSRICLRRCGGWEGAVPDAEAFFAQRLNASLDLRAEYARDATAGVRLVHGEGDGLPGLVVDRYANCLVLQSTSAVIEQHLDCIVPLLVQATGAEMVLGRNDLATRKFEGLPQEVRLLHGRRIEEAQIMEHGLRHRIDLWRGQKTGFFLDQRPARLRVLELARELCRLRGGATMLDLFSYQGGFAMAALLGGAGAVTAVDQSADALARAEAGAADNRLDGLQTRAGNAFDVVRELRNEHALFDLIVLDPPAFAKSRREVSGGSRGYRDLNRQALRLLKPGGYLLTCSCSHHIDLPMFERLLRQASAQLPFAVLVRERLMAGSDHPVWLSLPETEYLKSVLLQRALI